MRDSQKETFYGTELAGFAFFAMFAIYVIIAFIGNTVLGLFSESGETVYVAVSATFSVISMFLVILCVNRRRHEKIVLTVFVKKASPVHFLFSLILLCGIYLTFGAVNDAIAKVVSDVGLKTSAISVPLNSVWQLILFSALFGILPAVEEECFFRGLLLENLLCGGKKITAILICSLCFALYHGSITQLVYQFIFGVALSFLSVKSESVLPCILAHYLNNQAVLLFTYFGVVIDFKSAVTIFIGIALIIVFAVYLTFYKNNVFKLKIKRDGDGIARFFIPFGIIAIALCLILVIGGLFI